MKIFFNLLPFSLLGVLNGFGEYGLNDYRWWAWIAIMVIAFNIRDLVNKE